MKSPRTNNEIEHGNYWNHTWEALKLHVRTIEIACGKYWNHTWTTLKLYMAINESAHRQYWNYTWQWMKAHTALIEIARGKYWNCTWTPLKSHVGSIESAHYILWKHTELYETILNYMKSCWQVMKLRYIFDFNGLRSCHYDFSFYSCGNYHVECAECCHSYFILNGRHHSMHRCRSARKNLTKTSRIHPNTHF